MNTSERRGVNKSVRHLTECLLIPRGSWVSQFAVPPPPPPPPLPLKAGLRTLVLGVSRKKWLRGHSVGLRVSISGIKGNLGIVGSGWVNVWRAWRRTFSGRWSSRDDLSLRPKLLGSSPVGTYSSSRSVDESIHLLEHCRAFSCKCMLSRLTSVLWLIISVCECCSLLRQDCLLLPFVHRRPLFLMGECARPLSAHMAPGGRVGVPCSLCKHANVLQSGGSTAAMEAPLHTITNARQPNNRVWLRGRQANTLQMALLFTCLCVPLPLPTSFIYWDPQCHFQEPHGNSGPCQRGGQLSHDVTAPCDRRSAAERQNSLWDPNGTDIWTWVPRPDLWIRLCNL